MVILKLFAASLIVVFLTLASLFGYGSGIKSLDDLVSFFTGETLTYFRVDGADFCVKNIIRPSEDRSVDFVGQPVVLATFVQTAEIIDCDSVEEDKLRGSNAETIFISGELKASQYIAGSTAVGGGVEPDISLYNEGEGFWYNQENKTCLSQSIHVEDFYTAEDGVKMPKIKSKSRVDVFCKVLGEEKGQ